MPDVGNTLTISGNPSITGLNAGIAGLGEDITRLTQEVAPEFVEGQAYQMGDLISRNGYFYVFSEDFAGGTWEQAQPHLIDTTVATQIQLMPNKIIQSVESMRYTRTFIQETDPTLDPANDVHIGDYWIQIPGSKKWNDLKDTKWGGISSKGLGQLMDMETMYCWDGTEWKRVYDTSLIYTAYSRITQTEDMIKSEVYRANGAEGVLFTTIEQTADEIKLYAERYTDEKVAAGITVAADEVKIYAEQYIDENAYKVQSGISITAAGITVSGSQFVVIESGGYFRVNTGNFGIKTDASSSDYVIWAGASTGSQSEFSVKKNGDIKCTSGVIGGFTLADEWLTSGSGSSYVRLSGKANNTYAIVCGGETASTAPFWVKRDGTIRAKNFDFFGDQNSDGVYITEQLIRFKSGNSKVEITNAGVDVVGDMHVNLGVSNGNHVNISKDGIDMVGSRVNVNGKPMWARDDIIVLKNGEIEKDIIDAQASAGAVDWVLIKPYYNSNVQVSTNPGEVFTGKVYPSSTTIDASRFIPLNFISQETQLGDNASYYKFTVTCKIGGTAINSNTATAYIADLSNVNSRRVELTVTGSRNWDTNMQTASGTATFNKGSTGYQNVCNGNDIGIFLKTGSAASLNVSDIVVTVETSSSKSRVPCTVYYFPATS